MAESETKDGCTIILNNMKNKAPAEMYEQKKRKRKKEKKRRKKRRKKNIYFQQQGLEVFLETNS